MLKCVLSITMGGFKWRTNESQSHKVAEQAYGQRKVSDSLMVSGWSGTEAHFTSRGDNNTPSVHLHSHSGLKIVSHPSCQSLCLVVQRREASVSRQIKRGGLHAVFIRRVFAALKVAVRFINRCVFARVFIETTVLCEEQGADTSKLPRCDANVSLQLLNGNAPFFQILFQSDTLMDIIQLYSHFLDLPYNRGQRSCTAKAEFFHCTDTDPNPYPVQGSCFLNHQFKTACVIHFHAVFNLVWSSRTFFIWPTD